LKKHTPHNLFQFLLAGSLILSACALPGGSSPPQNILVILADDMGWADLGPASNIDTPHLDQLAQEGVSLSRFYASAPICSPTRAALLTGRYPHSVGMPQLAAPEAKEGSPKLSLDHSAVTLPEVLKARDYHSILIGKWHLGYDPSSWPRTHGFDEFWGTLAGESNYYDVTGSYHNETPIQITDYYTDAITDKAIDYLKTQETHQPFFMFLSYTAPHSPMEAPADLIEKYRTKYDHELFAIYAAMVEQLDTGIGRIMSVVDDLGLRENTLVIFMSDNGPSAESKAYGPRGANISNGPLREWKFSTYEGGIRVPFIARWPGRIPAGLQRNGIAVTMDVLPTILDAVKMPVPENMEIDGHSLMPLLTGNDYSRTDAIHWETKHNLAVIRGDWKLVHQFWKEPELYNLKSDISEARDLSDQYPEMVSEMAEHHSTWRAEHYPDPVARKTKRAKYQFPEVAATNAPTK
jgi:arylsulfatase A-like enzyme